MQIKCQEQRLENIKEFVAASEKGKEFGGIPLKQNRTTFFIYSRMAVSMIGPERLLNKSTVHFSGCCLSLKRGSNDRNSSRPQLLFPKTHVLRPPPLLNNVDQALENHFARKRNDLFH